MDHTFHEPAFMSGSLGDPVFYRTQIFNGNMNTQGATSQCTENGFREPDV